MTPNEILRAMLDERGVEWEAFDDFEQTTEWSTHNGAFVYWARERDGKLLVETTAPTKCSASCTPEQAIDATLGSSNCTNSERTNAACKPITYDNGYSTDHLDPGDYYEFWEPACACGNCGELIPMRKFCPNCGSRLEVDA